MLAGFGTLLLGTTYVNDPEARLDAMRVAANISVVVAVLMGPLAARNLADERAAPPTVDELISQLGSDAFDVRERAEKALIELGKPALEPLREALQSDNPEVRFRAGRAIVGIQNLAHLRRVEEFIDMGEPPDDALPGWARFRHQVGSRPRARVMFVAWQRAEPELFCLLESDPEQFAEVFAERAAEMSKAHKLKQKIPTDQNGALLFMAGEPTLQMNDATQQHVVDVAYAFRQRYLDGTIYERNVPVGWILRDDTTTLEVLAARTRIADLCLAREGIVPAKKILASLAENDSAFADAMDAIKYLGTKDDLPCVEAVFECRLSYFGSAKSKYRVEYRDVALAAALKMTRQTFYDYGFPRAKEDRRYITEWLDCGFNDEETRAKAFALYAQRRAEQKRSEAMEE